VQEILLIFLGLLVGTLGTLIGAGGGFLLVPVLYLMHPQRSAAVITAISLAVVFFNSASGSIAYARMRRISYRRGFAFVLASIPGVVAGANLIRHVPRQVFGLVFGILLVGLAALVFKLSMGIKSSDDEHGKERLGQISTYAFTALIGLLSSLLGIGGGIIHVPFLVHALGFPVHRATATSHFVLVFMSGIATIIHLLNGSLLESWQETLYLALGVVFGAQVGARLSHKIKGPRITQALAIALGFVGFRLLWRTI
jgi:uncharacterized membrane protein YfcA